MDFSSLEDENLIEHIIGGQTEALGVLYDRYSRMVFSLALHITGDAAKAEEITLDVFTRIWEKASTYRADRAKVNTWITSLARYRAIDVLRREKARPEGHSVRLELVDYELHASNPGPERVAASAIRQQRVREALASLPDDQRTVLELAYFAGLTHQQIAEKLGLPLGTAKTRIRLGLQKLRRALEDLHED